MRVCGIIAEYDPFHKGHLFQLSEAKKRSEADYMVCVISTAFTQRGLPALFSTHDRALMALRSGADLVLGMPVDYSCAQANRFAMGGAGILHALGAVTHISFGVEESVLPHMSAAAALVREPTADYTRALGDALDRGESFARAQGQALAASLCADAGKVLDKPNFNLAISYIQALSMLQSGIEPLPVIRRGDYHDTRLNPFPSATAVRGAILRGDWISAQAALPPETFSIVEENAMQRGFHLPGSLDSVLLSCLLGRHDFSDIDEISEGLDRRILKYVPQASSRRHLIDLVKTKRYPYARISRALTHCLLDIRKKPLRPPDYARLLGMRKSAAPLLERASQSGFPLITRPAKENHPGIAQDMRAEDLWYIGAGLPAASAWQKRMIIV